MTELKLLKMLNKVKEEIFIYQLHMLLVGAIFLTMYLILNFLAIF